MAHDKKISVIIPTYNSGSFIEGCLRSLYEQTYKDFEIIIVDDCSTDYSVIRVKHIFSNIRIISNSKQLGPEKSRNVGIKNTNSPYLALLDSDTVIDKNWLKELINMMESDALIGMCASKILTFSNPAIIENAGHDLYYDFSPIHRGEGGKSTDFDKNEEIFGICLAGAMVRKKVFNETGLFDEDYGRNLGDDEWSWRARLLGYKCIYVSKAIIYHKRSDTKKITKKILFRWEKNRNLSMIKYYSTEMIIASFCYTLKRFIRGLFYKVYKKSSLSPVEIITVILLAWTYALLKSPCFIKKRRELFVFKKTSNLEMNLWLKKNW